MQNTRTRLPANLAGRVDKYARATGRDFTNGTRFLIERGLRAEADRFSASPETAALVVTLARQIASDRKLVGFLERLLGAVAALTKSRTGSGRPAATDLA